MEGSDEKKGFPSSTCTNVHSMVSPLWKLVCYKESSG